MRRRQFITLLGGAATWPLAARAQQPTKVPKVGILSPATNETAATLTAFREGIRDLGYVEGKNLELDFRLSKGIMDASLLISPFRRRFSCGPMKWSSKCA